jgi:BirA family transcriptional regulator, biotin operon repressor / biotin---[acetyl-CoA-carboxylase] ligase
LPIPDRLPDDFANALEQARPRLRRLGTEILFFSSIGSTSDVASALAAHGDREGAVVIAEAQTAGRGRRGRTWFSPPASGLYASLVLAPGRARLAPERALALLTLAAGVALAEAVELVTGLAADIKWPNDLFVARRKLAGILAERVTRDAVVLGYGINVGQMACPRELSDRATSLELELGRAIDRPILLAETLAALARRYDDLLEGRFDAILDAWRARAPASCGTRVSWETPAGPRSGITAGVDGQGALLVEAGDQMERIVAGELQWL